MTHVPSPLTDSVNQVQAFCDSENGWAFYNGELRHGSNHEGTKYGSQVVPGDVIGVLFDSIQVSKLTKLAFGAKGALASS